MTNSTFFRRSARIASGLALCGVMAFGALAPAAHADDRDGNRGGDHRDDGRGRGPAWGQGGYYSAPPVVYGSPYYQPYYAPPPVVYGPAFGITVPGVNVLIR